MSYWILAVLVASGIVVFEGQSHGGLSLYSWLSWRETGARGMERVVGFVLCVAIGLRLFCMYVKCLNLLLRSMMRYRATRVKSKPIEGEWRFSNGNGHCWKQERNAKSLFYYVPESESETTNLLAAVE